MFIETNFWSSQKPKPYIIEKKVRRICFGFPGYIDEWVYYGGYETKEERDLDLKRFENFADPSAYEEYRKVDNRIEWVMN